MTRAQFVYFFLKIMFYHVNHRIDDCVFFCFVSKMFAISNRISFNSRINTLKFCLKLTPINSNHSNKLRIQLRSINIAGESAVKSSSQYQKPRSPVGYLFAVSHFIYYHNH